MVDRQIVYDAGIPQATDILNTNKFSMQAFGWALQAILGTTPVVNGLACTPTIPVSLQVTVGSGSIYELDTADATPYGDIGTDPAQLVKQGILASPVTLTITPPTTSGFSQVYLVQASLSDFDSGAQVLSFFNAANPPQPFDGPANDGEPSFTVRQCLCNISLKAGIAAATGSQVAPSPDAGFVGLYTITVANAQSTITSPNIATLATAPFFPTLPSVPTDVQDNAWTYAVDTSTGGSPAAVASNTSTSSAVLTFTLSTFPTWVTTGMKAFDLTATNAITGGQTVSSINSGAHTITLSANVNATVTTADVIAFSSNTYVATVSPIPPALVPGLQAFIKIGSTNTGVATLNLNKLGAVAIHRANGANVAAGDLPANTIAHLIYDGSFWQIINFDGGGGSVSSASTTTIPYTNDTSTTVNTVTANFTPTISTLFAGLTIEVLIANTNSGNAFINVNGLGAVQIVNNTGASLSPGTMAAGQVALMVYTGSVFQLINPGIIFLGAPKNFYVNVSTGSDTAFDGTSPTVTGGGHGPYATISKAAAQIALYNMNGFNITINVANGTYNESVRFPPQNGSGSVFLTGNHASPTSCVIGSVPGNSCIITTQGNWVIDGFYLVVNAGSSGNGDPGDCLFVQPGNVSLGTMAWGQAIRAHMSANGTGANLTYGGANNILQNLYVYGSSGYHALSIGGGFINVSAITAAWPTVTVVNSVTMGAAWAGASALSFCQPIVNTTPGQGYINAVAASGTRYFAIQNSIVSSNGGSVTYFPGTLGGILGSGGQYT